MHSVFLDFFNFALKKSLIPKCQAVLFGSVQKPGDIYSRFFPFDFCDFVHECIF